MPALGIGVFFVVGLINYNKELNDEHNDRKVNIMISNLEISKYILYF